MRRKSAGSVQMPRIREADAERLLYVRRIVDEWIARIAIPKPATHKLHAKRVVAIRRRTRPRHCGSC